jgi:hypothetical protein
MKRMRTVALLALGGLAATGLAAAGPAAGAVAAPPAGTMTTIAGGTGGPGAATGVSISPCAIKYADGSLYVGSGVVYRVSQRTGVLTTVAGSGVGGAAYPEQPGDGIPAAEFGFVNPCGTAVDGAGNVLVADSDQVLAVAAKNGTFYGRHMAAGRIYTVSSWAGEDGTDDVQLDSAGNLVMAEDGEAASHTNNETYAQIIVRAEHTGTFYGQRMVKGKLYVVAGLPRGGGQVPPDDRPARGPAAGGARATATDLGFEIGALRLDSDGNIVVADPGGDGAGAIGSGTVVTPSVLVIPVRSGTFYHRAMKAGYAYTIAGGGDKAPNGVAATSASLESAGGVALDHDGNVLIADEALRVVAARNGTFYGREMTAGDIYTLSTTAAQTVAVDDVGNVLFGGSAEYGSSASTHVYLLAEKTGGFYGREVTAGRYYTIAGNGRTAYSGDGGPATEAEFSAPDAIAASQAGTLTAVADIGEFAVRVIARQSGRHFGRVLTAGDVYTVAGGGTGESSSGGVPGPSVSLDELTGVAFDRAGNLVISDSLDHRVHVVADSSGVYYGQKMTAGDIYTIAGDGSDGFSGDGGPAVAASLGGPAGVAVDRSGNVLVIDAEPYGPARIRVVAASTGTFYGQAMTAGDVYTVAGDGTAGYSGDGGPATAAEIQPQGIAVDARGDLVIADGPRVRVVAASTGTRYGQAMTAGDIYTVAGGGTKTGDGTPALGAGLTASAIAVDQAGNLLVEGDYRNDISSVWMVAEKAGTYYGQAMRAGDVYTVAHSAGGDVFLDAVPATRALFSAAGVAVQPGTEGLLITDPFGHRVRLVSR